MTVDRLMQGKLTLGIGAGSADDPSHRMTGVEPWANAERVERLHEIVEIVDQMLRNPVTTYRGRYYQVNEAAMLPGPVQHSRPPLLIAAHGPKMLKLAARYADTWNTLVGSRYPAHEAPDVVRRANELVSEEAIAAGRPSSSVASPTRPGWLSWKPCAAVR